MRKKVYIAIAILVCVSILILIGIVYSTKVKEEIQIKKISSYNNPIIPKGFKKVETDSASWELNEGIPIGWNDGLVIEDEEGNQFVWVPVNIEQTNFNENDIQYNRVYIKDKMDINNQEDLQIIKYGGFYVARYEAGLPEDISEKIREFSIETNNVIGRPTSKKGKIVWNFVDWNTAKTNAQLMYNTDSLQSTLITTKQWNSIIYWLQGKEVDIIDSNQWGNYSDNTFTFTGYYSTDYGKSYEFGENKTKATYNMLLSTGATERNKSNNIYDLAGNVSEFTEVHKYVNGNYGEVENYYTCGGCYDNISKYSANYMGSIAEPNSRQGFRVTLYLK